MEGKIPIPFGVPVETRDVSWWHDRRQDLGSHAARMRKRGRRREREAAKDCQALFEAEQIAARDPIRQSGRKQARGIWKSGG